MGFPEDPPQETQFIDRESYEKWIKPNYVINQITVAESQQPQPQPQQQQEQPQPEQYSQISQQQQVLVYPQQQYQHQTQQQIPFWGQFVPVYQFGNQYFTPVGAPSMPVIDFPVSPTASITPNFGFYAENPENRSQKIDPARPRYKLKKTRVNFCLYCKSNGETEKFYRGHLLKDKGGDVICPILSKYVCPVCMATGANAHSLKYCPMGTKKDQFVRRYVKTASGKMVINKY